MLNFDLTIAGVLVYVGFAVRQNHDFLAVKMPVQGLFQAFCGPLSGNVFLSLAMRPTSSRTSLRIG